MGGASGRDHDHDHDHDLKPLPCVLGETLSGSLLTGAVLVILGAYFTNRVPEMLQAT